MDTVRIVLFLGEMYGLSCSACDIGNAFLNLAFATSAMSKFNMLPREGHRKAGKRILSYLKTFPK
jgi:hypothetical protein